MLVAVLTQVACAGTTPEPGRSARAPDPFPGESGPDAAPEGAPAEPPSGARGAGVDDWVGCSDSSECAVIQTKMAYCCNFGERRGVNVRFAQEARRAWGPSDAERREAEEASKVCVDDCAAPPTWVGACEAGRCVVTAKERERR